MAKKNRNPLPPEAPILHENHKRPVTRREFLGAGLISGSAMVMAPTLLSLISSTQAKAATRASCGIEAPGAAKIPFICFDLGGGANITGSNVLVGGPGGQFDFLSTAGYSKLGLPGDMVPNVSAAGVTDQIDASLGLAFHLDSAFVRGIKSMITTQATLDSISGAIIPNRSDNDTGDNPHNPMYGINKAGADGELLTLIGTRNSDSGGRSVAPDSMIDLTKRPTKIDQPSDSTGLVDTGSLSDSLIPAQAAVVMQAIERMSMKKINKTPAEIADAVVQDLVHCGYLKTTDTVNRFGSPADFDPTQDPFIQQIFGVTTGSNFANDTFRKTASVMNLVVKGYAGAGTIELGGYDYHDSTRATGEVRDFRAGQAMGACLEFAANQGVPVMLYCFTDGSLASNGTIDNSTEGRGKGVWTGDNSSTSSSFFLVYRPPLGGVIQRPTLLSTLGQDAFQHQQLGYFRSSGSVETSGTTPGANSVPALVEMIVLNYMALHGEQGNFSTLFPNHKLGTDLDRYTAFEPIVNGTITNPV